MSVKSDIEACGLAAGADLFHYERPNLENIAIDEVSSGDVLCYMEEVNSVNLTINSNGVSDSFSCRVSFIQQVDMQNTADDNAAVMSALLQCFRSFLIEIVKTGNYQKELSFPAIKYEENANDANFIGWQMDLTLKPRDGYSEC